jgi:uroporphyrinogen-III decarboxylase
MKYLANNSKFIIYFSFFDTGAIGLKEIQNYGVFAFSHQRELIIHKDTGFFVPELDNKKDMSKAYKIIMKKIEIITNLHPNTKSFAKINQNINKCQNALKDLCENIL